MGQRVTVAVWSMMIVGWRSWYSMRQQQKEAKCVLLPNKRVNKCRHSCNDFAYPCPQCLLTTSESAVLFFKETSSVFQLLWLMNPVSLMNDVLWNSNPYTQD
jgi:hypothetical protein